MEVESGHHIRLTFTNGRLPAFTMLLQLGFIVQTGRCRTVRAFLVEALGLTPEFIDGVIQSVFLDGKPVDDLDSAHMREGCTLALSAAMPGLVGATMRRGGYYAPLRSGISHADDPCRDHICCGNVTVKLFNIVASELGPPLLARGIRVEARNLEEFLASRPPEFWSACLSVSVDGQVLNTEELRKKRWGDRLVLLSVQSEPPAEASCTW